MLLTLPAPALVRRFMALAIAIVALTSLALAARPAAADAATKPTVVLVHGAFADASGWSNVIARLQDEGYPVVAPPNPLRGVSADAAYMRSFLSTIKGPLVLVGHSYGGVVITNAATDNPNVKGLVYVAAYAPDQGETVAGLGERIHGGMIGPATLDITPFPEANGQEGHEGRIKANVFRKIFAADLPAKQTAMMAASQRPASVVALGEPSGVPAWKSIKSWYLVAGKDNAIGTALERFMAKRAKATTVEIKGASHVVMMSRPKETTDLILRAARAAAR